MPSDRQRRRAVLLATGIVCSTISSGCFTSSFGRRAPDNAPDPSQPASASSDDRGGLQTTSPPPGRVDSSVRGASALAADGLVPGAALATPFALSPGSSSPAPAGEFPLELQADPGATPARLTPRNRPNLTAPADTEEAPAASTPLLDAAIKRVNDVSREQREAIASSTIADPPEVPKRPQFSAPFIASAPPAPKHSTRERFALDDEAAPLPARISRSPDDEPPTQEPASAARQHGSPASAAAHDSPPGRPSLVSPDPARDATSARAASAPAAQPPAGKQPAKPAPTGNASGHDTAPDEKLRDHGPALDKAPGTEVQASNSNHIVPLGIGELRLCRRVLGFGSFEPLADECVKAGQRILLYCELTGIQYEERGDDFVSRISSRVEIKRASGGPMLWQRELGDAQDVCRRRRRDYYVNYRLELPKTLGPGSYRLRLLQTDLVAGATTSTDIPLEIIP